MATASDVTKQIREITECSICSETFTNSRILPCVHSYCLKCIEQYGKDKRPGEQLACPLCRTEFTVPTGGLRELPKNFFIDRLCEISNISITAAVTIQCDLCSEVGEDSESCSATSLCLDCQQNLCALCTQRHRKQKFASNHKIVALGSTKSDDLLKSSPSYCKQHPNERITLHCSDCKSVICLICYVSSHNAHKCADVDKAALELDKQLQENSKKTAERLAVIKERMENLLSQRDAFALLVSKTEREIVVKAEELKKMIDEHAGKLLQEVNKVKGKTSKNFEQRRQEMEFDMVKLENMHRYIDEVRRRGSSADVCRAADDIDVKTNELMVSNFEDVVSHNLTFTSTDVMQQFALSSNNIVGKVSVQGAIDIASMSLTLEHTIPAPVSARVFGATSIAGCTYIGYESKPDIAVHDSNTFKLLRQMSVTPTLDPVDIKSCFINQCLYISDYNGCSVHRVSLSGTTTTWKVTFHPDGVSVTNNGNIVVCFPETAKIAEYKPDGTLSQVVSLQQHGTKPTHAIRLDMDTFVVCDSLYGHCSTRNNHRIFTISENCSITSVYGGTTYGGGDGKLYYPWHLADDQQGNVIVADYTNARVVLLSKSLTYIRELIPSTALSGQPCRLYLDKVNRRLLVGLRNGDFFIYKLA